MTAPGSVTLAVGRASYRITPAGEIGPWKARAFRVDVLAGDPPADWSKVVTAIAAAFGVQWTGGYRFGKEGDAWTVVIHV